MNRASLFRQALRRVVGRVLGEGGEVPNSSYRGYNVLIGAGAMIGRGTILRDDITIGPNTRIGDMCVLEGATTIGDNTDIESQCHITKYSRIGNHVFIAPFFLSTNDDRMAYHRKGSGQDLHGPTIEDYVRIAGHVMTLPGVTIGEGAVIGSYSLVTKDVKQYTLVYGVPAREREDTSHLLEERILPSYR